MPDLTGGGLYRASQLPPNRPQLFVDNMCISFDVGGVQRQEIKQWRGLQPGSSGYNEVPTSSCHTFCWKARQCFDVPFFYPPIGRNAAPQRRRRALARPRIETMTIVR